MVDWESCFGGIDQQEMAHMFERIQISFHKKVGNQLYDGCDHKCGRDGMC